MPPANTTPGYETRDVNTRTILIFVIVLFLVLLTSLVTMRWLFGYFSATQPLGPAASPFANTRTLPPGPRLQVDPSRDLSQVRQGQTALLDSYGWVDKTTGTVRIPIDVAMDIIAARHLPARQSAPADSSAPVAAAKEQAK